MDYAYPNKPLGLENISVLAGFDNDRHGKLAGGLGIPPRLAHVDQADHAC